MSLQKKSASVAATISQPTPADIVLSGYWTALGIGNLDEQLDAIKIDTPAGSNNESVVIDGGKVDDIDTVGVWILQKLARRLEAEGRTVQWQGWSAKSQKLFKLVGEHRVKQLPAQRRQSLLEQVGHLATDFATQTLALIAFVGETAAILVANVGNPKRIRWRPILYNIRSAGFDALPIVGLLGFLLGVIIAYQAGGKLGQYGANIFIADLVGLSILREFAPLMTAIIVAGRSGSAYAAQIGTMAVTEEIDAMRTLGIPPFDLLVLPKVIALVIALPLLTFFADVLGVFGGMLMARAQLGVDFGDFLDRFANAVSVSAYVIGVGKAPVFAAIIAIVGCFQGFRTSGDASSVGLQTTRSVVQAIFLVIVADAMFSVFFNWLNI